MAPFCSLSTIVIILHPSKHGRHAKSCPKHWDVLTNKIYKIPALKEFQSKRGYGQVNREQDDRMRVGGGHRMGTVAVLQ